MVTDNGLLDSQYGLGCPHCGYWDFDQVACSLNVQYGCPNKNYESYSPKLVISEWEQPVASPVLVINQEQEHNPFSLSFLDAHHNNVGKLEWTNGKLVFNGEADEAAKIFFDWVATHAEEHINKLIEARDLTTKGA